MPRSAAEFHLDPVEVSDAVSALVRDGDATI